MAKKSKEPIGLDKLFNKIEAVIARALIKHCLKEGYTISIHNGEDYEIEKSTKNADILKAMSATDEDYIRLYKDDKYQGTIVLIYGNGEDLISDQRAPTDEMLKVMEALVEPISKKYSY